MAKLWMRCDQWELKGGVGVMEDPIDDNKDDNFWSMVEKKIGGKKTKWKWENNKGIRIFESKKQEEIEQIEKKKESRCIACNHM